MPLSVATQSKADAINLVLVPHQMTSFIYRFSL